MRTLWMASMVFLVGALVSAWQNYPQTALLFASMGFALVHAAESNIDWQMRLTRRDGLRALTERRWQTTIVGKLAVWLSYLCLFALFVLHYR